MGLLATSPLTVERSELKLAVSHAAYFKYSHVCVARNGQAADPGRPDINWASSGQQIP